MESQVGLLQALSRGVLPAHMPRTEVLHDSMPR